MAVTSPEEATMKVIMFVVGSLREGSFNRQLADYAREVLSGRAEVRFLEYGDVPMLDQDEEFPPPAAVERVRGEVASMDGLWLFSPEYNGKTTPLLLNLLDWLSRPVAPGVPTVVTNMPVVLSSAAGGRQGAGALTCLSELCRAIKMYLVDEPGVGVGIGAGFGTGELALSDDDKARIQTEADALLAAVEG